MPKFEKKTLRKHARKTARKARTKRAPRARQNRPWRPGNADLRHPREKKTAQHSAPAQHRMARTNASRFRQASRSRQVAQPTPPRACSDASRNQKSEN
jgi:hypothetical protein